MPRTHPLHNQDFLLPGVEPVAPPSGKGRAWFRVAYIGSSMSSLRSHQTLLRPHLVAWGPASALCKGELGVGGLISRRELQFLWQFHIPSGHGWA